MGETGIGKTSLINLLCNIMESKMLKLDLHAGTTEK